MKNKFQIGEMAKFFRISSETLRHYDRIGLLRSTQDDDTKYRFYDVRALFQLSRILFLKSLDIPLNEIKMYMQRKSTENLLNMLRKKEKALEDKIYHLNMLKDKISTKLDLFDNVERDKGQVMVRLYPERSGFYLDLNSLKDESEIIQAFKDHSDFFGISSWLIEGQIYTSVKKESMQAGVFNQFRYLIEVPYDASAHQMIQKIPAGTYACLIVVGSYRDMSSHYETLTRWIAKEGYHICGDSIERNIVDYDFSDSEDEYVSEIQIPISKPL